MADKNQKVKHLVLIGIILFIQTSNGLQYTKFKVKSGNDYNQNLNYFLHNDQSNSNNMVTAPPNQIYSGLSSLPIPFLFNSLYKKNKKAMHKKKLKESNIFYIRLPATPYMMVPGLGYVSQPPNINPLLEPVPNQNHHQFDYGDNINPQLDDAQIQTSAPFDYVSSSENDALYPGYDITKTTLNKKEFKNSKIRKLRGLFYFNGRPEKVYILPNN